MENEKQSILSRGNFLSEDEYETRTRRAGGRKSEWPTVLRQVEQALKENGNAGWEFVGEPREIHTLRGWLKREEFQFLSSRTFDGYSRIVIGLAEEGKKDHGVELDSRTGSREEPVAPETANEVRP